MRLLAPLLVALVLVAAGCGGSGWRAQAERICAAGRAEALTAARGAGTAGLLRAGAALQARGARLAALDGGGPDLAVLGRDERAAGAALARWARTGDAGALRGARRLDTRAGAAARRLDLPACAR